MIHDRKLTFNGQREKKDLEITGWLAIRYNAFLWWRG